MGNFLDGYSYSMSEVPGDTPFKTLVSNLRKYLRAFPDRKFNVVIGVVFEREEEHAR